jgi:hypothetical protein
MGQKKEVMKEAPAHLPVGPVSGWREAIRRH